MDLTTNLNEKAMILVPIIAVLVNEFKRSTWIAALQNKLPIFTFLAIALGIGGAFLQGIPNPIVSGVIMGFLSSGIYSAAKVNGGAAKPNGS